MSGRFHTPSFGEDIFDFGDAATSTPTSMLIGGKNRSTFLYQQETPPSVKCMASHQNTSDEYYTANEESFNVTQNKSMNNSIGQQNSTMAGMAGVTPATGPTTMAARKQMLPTEQSEPAKPLSAYALFFRDTVSAIKQQNPTCSFQELSKIVASMWDALDQVDKGVYNKRNELARLEYLKQMKTYQQQQQLKQEQINANVVSETLPSDTNGQQETPTQQLTQPLATNVNVQQNNQQVNSTPATSNNVIATATGGNTNAPSNDQARLSNEADAVQKCLRENCNKRAIISPDWEDEYCSNECVVMHCRNVFNHWVQSNLEARQQEQQDANNK